MKRAFVVNLRIPDGISTEEVEQYIADAIGGWMGQFSPDDPMWQLDRSSIKVKAWSVGFGKVQQENRSGLGLIIESLKS